MEEDIKILEEYLDKQDRKFVSEHRLIILQAVENLIARYKELEKDNKKLGKENQALFEAYNFNDTNLLAKILKDYRNIILNSILKSKIKEKIKEINKEIDKCFISQNDKNFCFYECKENCSLNDTKKVLQELLEG